MITHYLPYVRRVTKALRLARQYSLALLLPTLLLNGCAVYSRVNNDHIENEAVSRDWIYKLEMPIAHSGDTLFMLGFSGGGTRAAAFSYGVLEELRDTRIITPTGHYRLLDEVDSISSVSGGSFTAAYYGLFGDRIFDDYEQKFLKNNVQKILLNGILNPFNWWKMLTTGFDRTELAVDYYDNDIFEGKTFGDLKRAHGPYIQINATDLSLGSRFPFTQGFFDLLCADYDHFSIARAVAASSAVPVAFAPIVIKNYDTCNIEFPAWFSATREQAKKDLRLAEIVKTIDSYVDKSKRRYIHLVDGGITDNLGVRALYDRVILLGSTRRAAGQLLKKNKVNKIVVLLVNAQTHASQPMEQSEDEPSVNEVIDAVTDAQLQRYNTESLILVENSLKKWATDLSTAKRIVKPYFIHIDFDSIADTKTRQLFNNIATSFSLPGHEVEDLVSTARALLRWHPVYQELVHDLQSGPLPR